MGLPDDPQQVVISSEELMCLAVVADTPSLFGSNIEKTPLLVHEYGYT
jgi:hypothetical protein